MSEKGLAYTHHAAYTMAGLLGAGGLYGGFVKGSRGSLLAGGILATVYGAAGWYAQQGEYLLSNQLAALAGGALALAMGARYLRTRATLPLALSSLGVASATYHAVNWAAIEPIKVPGYNAPKMPPAK